MDPFEITVRYNVRDWIRFQVFTAFRNWKVLVLGILLMNSAIAFIVGVDAALLMLPTSSALLFLGNPILAALGTVAKARRQPDGDAVTLRLDEDGVHTQSGGTSAHMPWNTVGPRIDTRHLLLMELSAKNVYLLLPRRLLNPEQLAAVGAWLSRRDRHDARAEPAKS